MQSIERLQTKISFASPLKGAYWISSNIAIGILEFFSIAPPLVIALPTLR